jgi:hypothetical protein
LGLWPETAPLELSDGAASPALDEIVHGPSAALTAVALVAGDSVRGSGWAARAAVAIARQWRGPRRVVLMDLDLERPSLHDIAGVANDEGAAELIDFGLSLAAVRRSVGDGGFDIVTAGVYAPEPGALLRHDDWGRILLEAAAHRSTLLVFVPASADGVADVVDRAGAVLVLADDAEAAAIVQAMPRPFSVLAVLTPDVRDAEAAPVEETAAAPPPEEAASEAAEDEPLVVAAAAEEVLQASPDLPEPLVLAAAADEVVEAASQPDVDEAAREALPPVPADEAAPEWETLPAVPADEAEPEPQPEPEWDTLPPIAAEAEAPAAPEPTAAGGGRLTDEEFARIRLPTDRASRDALIVELRDRQRAARMAPPPPRGGVAPVAPVAAATAGAAVDAAVPQHSAGADETAALLGASGSEHAREMRVESAADDVGLETLDPGAAVLTPARERRPAPPVVAAPAPPRKSRFRRSLVGTLLAVLALSLLAGTWRYLSGRLGWDLRPGTGADAGAAPAAPPPVDAPAQTTPALEVELPFAVAMEAYTDVVAAADRLDILRATERAVGFHVAPLEREGTLYYHVMAGPVRDSAAAVALRDTLLARRLKTATTPSDVRFAPLAFLIGDYASRFMAQEQMLELRRLDVPSYMMLADAEDGEPLYRVYVGGFATPAEAEVTRQLLRAAGVRDSLVTRTGIIAP